MSGGPAWYEEWFDRPEYDVVYSRRDEEDARRLLELILDTTGLAQGSRILDMACGRGRHSRLMALEGYVVTGVDLSPRAIQVARAIAISEKLDVEFRVGDMREAPCTECFDMVVNLFTSFGYFEDEAENERAIGAMAQALVRSGWLIQDHMNGAYWRENFVPEDERVEGGLKISQRRWLDGNRLNKEITLENDEGDRHSFTESVRLYETAEFRAMYDAAGLELVDVRGGSDGQPVTAESKRLVLFSRKP